VTDAQSPEEIRREIEETRSNLGHTLEDIEDRVSPSRIKERRVEAVKGRWQSVRESVMGSAQDTRYAASDRAGDAADTLRGAPDQALQRARGNPLAAGLIAFGGGMLLASLLPSSDREQDVVQTLRDRYEEPVKSELQSVGKEAAGRLQGTAQEAVEEVKSTAQEAAQQTRSDAQQSAQNVREQTTS
jgi:gas vesicle protein